MAKKNGTNQSEAKEVEIKVAEEVNTKDALYASISKRVDKYNSMREIGAFKVMNELKGKINEEVAKYTKLSQDECFASLRKKKNPLLEAAKILAFETIAVKEKKLEDGSEKLVIDKAYSKINPRTLHDKVVGGIGANKAWKNNAEALNCFLTCRRAFELGIDPKAVHDTYKMSKAALEVACYIVDFDKLDEAAINECTYKFLQSLIDDMIGTVKDKDKNVLVLKKEQYKALMMGYQRADNANQLKMICANHSLFAIKMLDLCNAVITGRMPEVGYKVIKSK